jgi:hypothetical protein
MGGSLASRVDVTVLIPTGQKAHCRYRPGIWQGRSEKGDRSNLCEAGHRPEVGRGPFRKIGPVPFFASNYPGNRPKDNREELNSKRVSTTWIGPWTWDRTTLV